MKGTAKGKRKLEKKNERFGIKGNNKFKSDKAQAQVGGLNRRKFQGKKNRILAKVRSPGKE
jgi:hypothetical protein